MGTAAGVVLGCGSGAPWPVRVARAPLRLVLWLAMRVGLRITVEGVRVDGPAIVASNHPNLIDGLLVLMADACMRPIARWHRQPIVRLGLWIGDSVITTTGTPARPERGAYAGALAHLRAGGRVWIAPEGGWQPETTLRPPRTGAVRLAHAASVPIQVLAIRHTPHPGPDLSRWPWRRHAGSRTWGWRPRVTLHWGPCLTTTGDVADDGDRLMTAIAAATDTTWSAADLALVPAPSGSLLAAPPEGPQRNGERRAAGGPTTTPAPAYPDVSTIVSPEPEP
ncbi:MAG TPA: lysophospholipid acyltransferase family protein [Euzebyales bacterium]|nr:lysophospholipid acyltransferase family protein [Euzebyales bacterium]